MEQTLMSKRADGARFADIAPEIGVSTAAAETRHRKLRSIRNG